jgi:site-specific recombinase XerD
MSKQIDRVDVREKLAYRRDPYWKRITAGRHIGFRRMTPGKPGTWLARAYTYTEDGYVYETLGDFAERLEKERYDAAKGAAEHWFRHLDMGGSTVPTSVKAACDTYLENLKNERGEQAKKDTEGYFRRLVYKDPIARVMLSKLSKAQMAGWRERALAHNNDRSSFNRNITPLRAALNLAVEQGKVASDQAWLNALRPFSEQEMEAQCARRRTGYLDRDERRALVEAASTESRPLFKALALLPMRPGEVAALRVESLKVREKALEIVGKTGRRTIPLSQEALSHFKGCATSKLPGAWLIARADGSQWTKERWKEEIKPAAHKAKLPKATVCYTLRHSLITDLVVGGLDIFTVAKLAGTSVRMIEKHYGHLQREHARSALEKLA